MNKVILIGRLTKDPDLRYTPNGVAVCNFTVACDKRDKDGNKDADFISVVVWNKSAENLAQYKRKGDQIAVEGSLQTRSYEAQDGSKRYITEVLASRIEFIGNKSDGSKKATPQSEQPQQGVQYGQQVSFSDEDLPF